MRKQSQAPKWRRSSNHPRWKHLALRQRSRRRKNSRKKRGAQAVANSGWWKRKSDASTRKGQWDLQKIWFAVTTIFLAAGATIGAVVGTITKALKKCGEKMGDGLKTIGAKASSVLPGLIGAIVSYIFKAAGSVIGFFAKHTWLLILAVVVFLFEELRKRRS